MIRLCRNARAYQYCVTTSTVLPLRQGALCSRCVPPGTLTRASDAPASQCLFEDIPLRGKLVRCGQVDVMNEPLRPAANTDDNREDAKQERGYAADHGMSVEAARNEAEQVRQLAEDVRNVRDQQREALETIRQERERLRDTAETARAANEQNRGAAEAARHAVVDGVRATADTLNATLEHMKLVEEMRRTLREIRDVHKLDSN